MRLAAIINRSSKAEDEGPAKHLALLREEDLDARRWRLDRAMAAIEVLTGLIIFVAVVPRFEGDILLFAVLLALNLAAERAPITIYGESKITVGFVFTLPILALFGAPGAAILAPLEGAARRFGSAPFDLRYVRTAFRYVAVYAGAAFVYSLIAPVHPSNLTLQMVPAGLAATAFTYGASAVLITTAVSLKNREPWREVWANHRWIAPHYLAFGVVGLGLLASFLGLGYAGILAYLTPAAVLRYSVKQYVDKTAENVEKLRQQNQALRVANVEITRVSDELRITYDATLEALVSALEARDQETKGHSVRVARYMLTIAEALGVNPGTQEWRDMQHGALLHDVGKIGVRDSILLKPGKLSPEEWEAMRQHPEIGFRILREVNFLDGAAQIVLAHHERWDGAGYPRGLKAEEIPLGSRIFAVVDTFDSMTSDRPYRPALSPKESLDEILRCSGTQFDPLVVEAFLDIYDEWVLEREKFYKPGEPLIWRAA